MLINEINIKFINIILILFYLFVILKIGLFFYFLIIRIKIINIIVFRKYLIDFNLSNLRIRLTFIHLLHRKGGYLYIFIIFFRFVNFIYDIVGLFFLSVEVCLSKDLVLVLIFHGDVFICIQVNIVIFGNFYLSEDLSFCVQGVEGVKEVAKVEI
jgi:hypothetical protein